MPDLTPYLPSLPLAVAVALGLFVAKETLEATRRFITDRRKLTAIRTLVAAECRRNAWTISKLKDALERVASPRDGLENIYIETRSDGAEIFSEEHEQGHGSFPLTPVHRSAVEKFMFEAASLDRKLFEQMVTTLEAVSDIDHVRRSLIHMVKTFDPHLEGFGEYGLSEIADARVEIEGLFRLCEPKAEFKASVR